MVSKLSRRSSIILKLQVLGMMVILPACGGNQNHDGPTPVLSGAPSTSLPLPPSNSTSVKELGWVTMSGTSSENVQRTKIGDYRGKVLVLDMYATWCAPCRESIPQLVDLQRRYGPKGLQIVGLNVGGADDRVKVPEFAQQLGINYTLGFPDRQLTDVLMSGDATIPQTFVFSRDGTLVQHFVGYHDIAAGKLEQLILTQTAAEIP
jgi:thiol-disulfide isomerase/thioredoxin